MTVLDKFNKIRRQHSFDLDEKNEKFKALLREICKVTDEGVNPEKVEGAADQLIDLCEELLLRASPPDKDLLLRHGVNVDKLLAKLDHNPNEPKIIGVDSDIDDRSQVEFEKALLCKLKPRHSIAYKRAILTKLAAILSHSDTTMEKKREQSKKLLERASTLFHDIQDREGVKFIQDQQTSLDSNINL